MNKGNVSENRIQTTAVSLNHTLIMEKGIRDLRISLADNKVKFMSQTVTNAMVLRDVLVTKLGTSKTRLLESIRFDSNILYKEAGDPEPVNPYSNTLEQIWETEVLALYLKHQDTWDNYEEIEECSDDEDVQEDADLDW